MVKISIKKKIKNLKPSSTLAINEKSNELIKLGKRVYRFGFGQSPFPVPEKIVECLKSNAVKKEYLPVQGLLSPIDISFDKLQHFYIALGLCHLIF